MKLSKRILCVIMAVAVMMGTLGLMTAFADSDTSGAEGSTTASETLPSSADLKGDPNYLFKFNKNMNAKWLSCDQMTNLFGETIGKNDEYVEESTTSGAKIAYNSDNSITISKNEKQLGANLEIPVTDEMKANYSKATDNKFYISFYLSQAEVSKSGINQGKFAECQVRIYTKFKTPYVETLSNGTKRTRYIKLTTLGKNSYDCYQQMINREFKFVDSENKPLQNLDNVESIIVSLYHYDDFNKTTKEVNAYKASVEMSSIAYEGVPQIKKFVSPAPESASKSISFTEWNSYYRKEWADKPSTVKYNAAGGYNSKDYKTTQAGWIYFNHINDVVTKQLCLFHKFDRDAFNKAIVTANQDGGTKKAKITVNFPKINDNVGESMIAEFQLQYYTYSGETYTPIQQWIKAGQEKTFEFDVSDIDVNSVSYVKTALMAFWQYDKNENKYYDTDKMKRYDKNGNVLTAKYDDGGTLLGYANEKGDIFKDSDIAKYTANCSDGRTNVDITSKIKNKVLSFKTMKNVEGYISPIYTVSKGGSNTTAPSKSKTTTTSGTKDYEHAGYHFFDFTQEAFNECFGIGTHPSNVNFLFEDYYQKYEIADKDMNKDGERQGYKNNNSKGTKVTADSTYKKQFAEAKDLGSGGYQVEIASPYPRVQQQHQCSFFLSGKQEDKDRVSDSENHKPRKPQNEKYDYKQKMADGLKYAKEHTDPEKRGYLAVDVYAMSAVHGYKNAYNSTYKAWCKKNGKKAVNETSVVQALVSIHANNEELGGDISVTMMEYIPVGQKKTIYLDVSELEIDDITSIRFAAQNYANLANKEQGGTNNPCGITDVQARFSAIYIPGLKNTDRTTTTNNNGVLDKKEAQKIKKLYDALPGLTVDDYNTDEDYDKLMTFIKAWTDASKPTQEYCEKEYKIDYAEISMLESDVYEKLYGSGGGWDGSGSPGTGDVAFPMLSLLVAGLSGYVIVRTRKKK